MKTYSDKSINLFINRNKLLKILKKIALDYTKFIPGN